MKTFTVKLRHIILSTLLMLLLLFVQSGVPVAASPFGNGNFGTGVFGSQTSLVVNVGSPVTISMANSGGPNFSGQGSHTVSVTTNNTTGYQLYIYSPVTGMKTTGTGQTIPASANSSATSLASNTWGYNLDGSTNYLGMTNTPTLLKTDATYSATARTTQVYYGINANYTTAAGSYSTNVVYTAVVPSDAH